MVGKIKKNLIPLAIVIAGFLIAGALIYINQGKVEKISGLLSPQQADDKLEILAKCLSRKGAKFYGAYWCGWCNKQKELFGEAAQYLPYIECAKAEAGELTPECQKAGITGFPTWEFNSQKNPGFKTFEELAELSGCPL